MNRYLLLTTAFCAIGTVALPAQADGDTFQINVGTAIANNKNDNKLDTTSTTGYFKYFLSPVAIDQNQPYGEAEFIQRASNLIVRGTSTSYEDKNSEKTRYGGYGFDGVIYYRDWFLSGSSFSNDFTIRSKANNSRSYAINDASSAVGIGFYFLPLSTLAYSRSQAGASYSPSNGLAAILDIKNTSDALAVKTLLSLQNGQSLGLQGSWTRSNREQTLNESNKIVQVDGAYYLNPKMYLNLGYSKNTGDRAESEGNRISYGVGFTTNYRLLFLVQATKFSAKNSGIGFDSSSLQASAQYRF